MSTLKYKNVLNCLALDPCGTKVREDAFSCRTTSSGWELVIAVVIPPVQLIKTENTEECLSALFQKTRNMPDLFPKNIRLEHSLKENFLRPVLSVEYFINNKGQVREELIYIKRLRSKWIDHDCHNKKRVCDNAFDAIDMIHKNHEHGNVLSKKAMRWDKYGHSFDHRLSNLLLDLFSFTCRATCKNAGIPYYHPRGPNKILVSDLNYGRFHRPMRDILALTNLLNLHNHLIGRKNSLVKEIDLFSILGSTHKFLIV